jgi:hypothetical protein
MRVVTNHADQNKKQKEIIMSNSKKETPRQCAAAQLFDLVTELTRSKRWYSLDLLLGHACISGGTNAYACLREDWNECDTLEPYLQLLKNVSPELADAWVDWAWEIGTENPSRETCRVVILNL